MQKDVYVMSMKLIAFSDSPYTVNEWGEQYISVDCSGGAVTVKIPEAPVVVGWYFIVKDRSGNAAANNITIKDSANNTIDTISANGGTSKLIYNGTGYEKFI